MLKKGPCFVNGNFKGYLRVYPTCDRKYVPIFSLQVSLLLRRDFVHSQEFLRDMNL